jgi:hypothetical protein
MYYWSIISWTASVVNWLMCFPRSGPAKDRNKRKLTFLPPRYTEKCQAKDSYNRKFTFSRYDAGFIHMLTGMFGLVVFVMKYVGPITVIPTVLLIGLNAFNVTTQFCQVHWGHCCNVRILEYNYLFSNHNQLRFT